MDDRQAAAGSWATQAHVLHAGQATGAALVLDEPLSLWGGLDPETGSIIDRRHPQLRQRVSGRILVMTSGRGSSSSSTVLAEALRAGKAPAAIVLAEPDAILVLGAIVALLIDGITMPIVHLDADSHARITSGDWVQMTADGNVTVTPNTA